MSTRQHGLTLLAVLLLAPPTAQHAAEPLTVASDFEGASVSQIEIDGTARSVSFRPGGDPARGWPCWWYFRVDGVTPGETITLRLRGDNPAETEPTALAAIVRAATAFSTPAQATFSTDGKIWRHTEKGTREGDVMTYTIKADAASVLVAWGPPYTPSTAAAFVRAMSEKSPHSKVEELCRSREGRSVPMLHVQEGGRTKSPRFGVWVQARQHAWESGSSWVAQGFGEWLVSDAPEAAWLRQHAEIFLVPIMDIDNTATGNGGKNAQPHDHNRDWSELPHSSNESVICPCSIPPGRTRVPG